MATIVRPGTNLESHTSFGAVGTWIEANHYEIAGPCREVFLEPITGPPGFEGALVEIQFPIRPRRLALAFALKPPNPDASRVPATRTAVPNSGRRQTQQESNMLTIHGVPLSVHTRKTIVTAILKKIDYRFEVVIPVIPGNPPANWSTLSPTGLIPVMQDGDFTLADSTAICLYLDKEAAGAAAAAGRRRRIMPARCGSTPMPAAPSSGIWCIRCSSRRSSGRTSASVRPTRPWSMTFSRNVLPKIFGYLEAQIDGKFLVGDALTLADIAIVSNFIVYQYLGFEIDAGRYPKLSRYLREIAGHDVFQRALDDEKPFVEQMGLDRSFLQ